MSESVKDLLTKYLLKGVIVMSFVLALVWSPIGWFSLGALSYVFYNRYVKDYGGKDYGDNA